MKYHHISRTLLAVGAFAVLLGLASCKSDTTSTPTTTSSKYQMTTLVSDTAGYGAARIDKSLANAWGISVGPTGNFWLSSNHGGVTDIYDGTAATSPLAPITIPSRNGTDAGSPTGVVFNSNTADFNGYLFIYCSEDGIISGWKGGASAVKAATDPSADAVYKGMALGNDGGNNFLYVADFKQGKISVYNKNFTLTGKPFIDPAIPAGYAPFNIANIGGMLYVAYAKQHTPPDNDDQSGAGNGYINIFKTDGTLVKRFASNGVLNSPWGIAQAPAAFGDFSNAILVGNFGDGAINGFDSTGKSLGPMKDANGKAISIEGLWGLMSFGPTPLGTIVPNSLYFTSGPAGESHGIFGYIKLQ